MLPAGDLSYVQARIQARHGARPAEAEWHALEAARSATHYLERARSGGLARFSQRLSSDMDAHAAELELRAVRRAYVREVTAWMPGPWRPAVAWSGLLPDLPVLAALLSGLRAAPWMAKDPVFGPIAQAEPHLRPERFREARLGALVGNAPGEGQAPVVAAWLARWRAIWPSDSARELRQLERLIGIGIDHVARLGRAEAGESSAPERQVLATALTGLFRSTTAAPAAVFCHLALVALDVERFRGGLVRRLLVPLEREKEAA